MNDETRRAIEQDFVEEVRRQGEQEKAYADWLKLRGQLDPQHDRKRHEKLGKPFTAPLRIRS